MHGAIGPRENLTLGHEAVGIIHEVGSEVRDFRPGDRVVVAAITPDWGDVASQAGHSSQSGQPLGGWKFSNTKDGVFAQYFHVNEADANLAHIPSTVPDEAAVYCADMITTGLMGAENADIPIGPLRRLSTLLMSGGWRRRTVSGRQRLQFDAWTAPDRTATAPVLDSTHRPSGESCPTSITVGIKA